MKQKVPDKINEFLRLAEQHIPYLSKWYLDTPALVTPERFDALKKLQETLYTALCYFVAHADEYDAIFPLTFKVRRILEVCRPYPYRPGTYRPDFLIDENGQLRLCEIGARFPLNGYFLSGIAECIGARKFGYLPPPEEWQYAHFLNHLFAYWGAFDELYVLKGADHPCDIKYYIPYFEALGICIHQLSPEELARQPLPLENVALVNEFNQMEIERLPLPAVQAIASARGLNDMRSIFLIHDKRFLAVLSDPSFQRACLSRAEIEALTPYLIPTYTRTQRRDLWEEAYHRQEDWVIKHSRLGKSEKVYAGCVTSREKWQTLFVEPEIEEMVLQPFIRQRKIHSAIGGSVYHDFAVGTLLCFDEDFFGPGLFRTSSFEITNRLDDRKMAPCFTDRLPGINDLFIL